MFTVRPGVLPSLLLVVACAAPAPPPAAPGRSYAGTCDAGSGRLELGFDHTFRMEVVFAYFGIRWDLGGEWRPGADDRVELVVLDSRVQTPPDLAAELGVPALDRFEPGTELGAFVDERRASFGGPCTCFYLPRVR
jgi:hypothetical protein